jgi:hypothetical protein
MGREGGAFTTKYLYGCRSVGKDQNGCPSPIANGVYDPLITIISWYYIYGPSCPAKYPTKLGGGGTNWRSTNLNWVFDLFY